MDRRKTPRNQDQQHILVQRMGTDGPCGEIFESISLNRSAGGLCFLSPVAWEEGTELWVQWTGEDEAHCIPARAYVTWCDTDSRPYLVGLTIEWIRSHPVSGPPGLGTPMI
jgi:hypothetical protein